MSDVNDEAACSDQSLAGSISSAYSSKETISTNSKDAEIFKNMDWSMHVFGDGESKEDFLIEDKTYPLTPVMFHWPGPAESVYVAGSYDGWKEMTPLKMSHSDFFTIINVNKGSHQYKFLVDGQWTCNMYEPKISHESKGTNNLLTVDSSDSDVFEALDADDCRFSSDRRNRKAEDWTQVIPPKQTGVCRLRAGPPSLPPHLLNTILNKETPSSCNPNLLQEPTHVILNHLYTHSIKDGVLVLGVTHRYRKKYITTLLYRPQ